MGLGSIIVVLGTFTLVVLSIWLWKLLLRPRKLPPGVRGLNAVKFLVACIKNGFEIETSALMHALDTDLISIDIFGLKTMIVFGSQDKLTEAYQKKGDLLLKRPQNPVKPDTVGLLAGYGTTWREQRRFALTTLRNLGMGKTSIEQRILDEVQGLIGLIAKKSGNPFDPINSVGISVLNVVSSVIFSSKFAHDDPDLFVMLENFNHLASGSHLRALVTLTMFDSFFKLPGIKDKIIQRRTKNNFTRTIMKKRIEDAIQDGLGGTEDFVDAYMMEMKRREDDPETSFTETQLVDAVEDLFGAGTETTSTTLRWGLLFIAHNQDVQERVYEELKEYVGTNRLPVYADRERTPYTEAVLLEIQRFGGLVPLIRRQNSEPIVLFNYDFEPDTNFIANFWHINRDEKVWAKPHEFFPGHFINENGELMNKERFNPFGLGKRQCLGESLAKMELYLFFAALILNFRFQAPEGVELPAPWEASVGLVRAPLPYEICAIKREHDLGLKSGTVA